MVKRLFFIVPTAVLVLSWLFGCGGEGTGPGGVEGIQGTVTYKDGTTPVAGATVTATSTLLRAEFTTNSGDDGEFSFTGIPDGGYHVTAEKSSFRAEADVTVTNGRSSAAITMALDIDASKLGVVPGSYDDMGAILSDLGYGYTTLTDADLADASNLAPLELLFLNCGSDTGYSSDSTVQDNLKDYVDAGGYLYASDWDYLYVEHC